MTIKKYGTESYDKGGSKEEIRGLSFRPKVESEIYHCTPHNFWAMEGKLKVPTAFIGGQQSRELMFMYVGGGGNGDD